ncbi:MAG: alpha/beta hydrolase [Porphyrobacter sp.]|jgi:putative phosphoribosyl transferase|nr:alpha/beta hydrolase [Porphyrobacter sp.]
MADIAFDLRFFGMGSSRLPCVVRVPPAPRGLVLFAHGSFSSHRSPRNNAVAERLSEAGFVTMLFDLLSWSEARNRANVFDIGLLSGRLIDAMGWIAGEAELAALPIGLFGASTGAGAALRAAALCPARVAAVVSRGGRPDLAGAQTLGQVQCPVQLIVGSLDQEVIGLNRAAAQLLRGPRELVIVPGAGHLFEEPGAMEQVVEHARSWFMQHLAQHRASL